MESKSKIKVGAFSFSPAWFVVALVCLSVVVFTAAVQLGDAATFGRAMLVAGVCFGGAHFARKSGFIELSRHLAIAAAGFLFGTLIIYALI